MSTQADRAQSGDANSIQGSEPAVHEPGIIAGTGMTGIVTHNLAQAVRIASRTIFLNQGRMAERSDTKQLFEDPERESPANYVGGRFG